jgi:hypothetical protein
MVSFPAFAAVNPLYAIAERNSPTEQLAAIDGDRLAGVTQLVDPARRMG